MPTTRRDLCKLLALAPVAAVLPHGGKQVRPYDIERRRTLHRDYAKYGVWVSQEDGVLQVV